MAIIEVENLRKSFFIPSIRRETIREHFFGLLRPSRYDELKVLQSVSFSVEKGESLGIMGRNGSGKSTLLKILAQIYRPDGGSVAVRAPVTPILNLGVGWNSELTAHDNIYLTGTAMGLSLKELSKGIDEILHFADLTKFENLELKFYSSGMSARLAYAIAFRAVREILLLDEIFAVGDVGFQQRCKERYRTLHNSGHTLILVAHDPAVVREHCSRALLIEEGQIVMDDSADRVVDAYERLLAEPEQAEQG